MLSRLSAVVASILVHQIYFLCTASTLGKLRSLILFYHILSCRARSKTIIRILNKRRNIMVRLTVRK